MLKSLAPKLAIGLLGAGTITAGAVYATLPEKYSHHFSKQGRKLITDFDKNWDEINKVYSAEGEGLLIKEKNGSEIAKSSLTKDKWKEWCTNNSNGNFTNTKNEIYQRVSAWCTEPKKIIDLIGKGKRALNDTETSGSVNPDESDWNIKKTEYNNVNNKQLIKVITNSGSKAEGDDIAINSLDNTNKLRAWCGFSKEKTFKHEEDPRYLKYLRWCVK